MSEEVEEVVEQEAAAEEGAITLGVADLNLMANVLEAVAQRGAIRANEMQSVGVLYNRLIGFLVANGARPAPGVQEEVAEEAETGEADNA